MEIQASPLDWTFIDSENLAKFLDTETGKRLLPKLADLTPPLFNRGETNELLIRSGTVLGCQHLIREILNLAHPSAPPAPVSNSYPPPEDGKAWGDDLEKKFDEQFK